MQIDWDDPCGEYGPFSANLRGISPKTSAVVSEGFQKFAGIPCGMSRICGSLITQQTSVIHRKNRSILTKNPSSKKVSIFCATTTGIQLSLPKDK